MCVSDLRLWECRGRGKDENVEVNRKTGCLLMNCLSEKLSFSSHCQNLVKYAFDFSFISWNMKCYQHIFFSARYSTYLPFVEWLKLKLSRYITRVIFPTFSDQNWTFSIKMLSDLWTYLLWCLSGTDFPPDHCKQLQRSNKTGNLVPVSGRSIKHLSFLSSAYLHDCIFFSFAGQSLSSISVVLASLHVFLGFQISVTHLGLALFQTEWVKWMQIFQLIHFQYIS